MMSGTITQPRLIYDNPLSQEADLKDFRLEGQAVCTFPEGKLRLENALNPEKGQAANYVLWCREEFPADFRLEVSFRPLREPGLAMIFFAARGRNSEDLFDPRLAPRTGEYIQYHHGDIDAFHLSFFRRKEADERRFHTCNLRKSYGFHLVAQGADPIPDVADATQPYLLNLTKQGDDVRFAVDGLEVLHFRDDGSTFGPPLAGGKIGFRQLAPMIGEYSDLKVYAL